MVKNEKKVVIGISAFYHDSAAAIVVDGVIIAAAHEERFTRIKHDPAFPRRALAYCLTEANLTLRDVSAVVFYDKPYLKFERLLETYLYYAPRGVRSFISAAIVWIKEKFFLRSLLEKELAEIDAAAVPSILFTTHHLAHAASAFYPSPYRTAAIVTLDGVGEWATTSISYGEGGHITSKKEIHFPHSIGLLYSAFTYYLGFKVNSGEYKLMGLAPYGNPESAAVTRYTNIIWDNLVVQHEDGSFALNQTYFNYATGSTMTNNVLWERIFGLRRKEPDEALTQAHCDLALAIQNVTETLVLGVIRYAQTTTGSENLCLAGGVALNCVANNVIRKAGIFKNIWVQPAAGDAGGALGAALAASYIYFDVPRIVETPDSMRGAYLGPAYSGSEIEVALKQHCATYTRMPYTELYPHVAKVIAHGNVIGWFQGRMEWGPRALGGRSILADPRDPNMQKKLNLRVKMREGFRPFAPSILSEHVGEFFVETSPSPYMLFVTDVAPKQRHTLPHDFHSWDLYTKLYFIRSTVPAVTHLDFSARIQTVHKETNIHYWNLINAFYTETGFPLLINTSFNVRGEPIVSSPEDALRCFMHTDMDYLCIGEYILAKNEQMLTAITQKTFAAD